MNTATLMNLFNIHSDNIAYIDGQVVTPLIAEIPNASPLKQLFGIPVASHLDQRFSTCGPAPLMGREALPGGQ